MSVSSAQVVAVLFTLRSPTTGVAANGDSLPTAILVINGVNNAAAVTIVNITTGRYKATVTLPTLAEGDICEILATATVGGVADSDVVWSDSSDPVGGGGSGASAAQIWAYAGGRSLTTTVTPSANTNTCNVIVQAESNNGSAAPDAVVEFRNYTPNSSSTGRAIPGSWTQAVADSTGIATCTVVVDDLYQYRVDGGTIGYYTATSTGSVAIGINLMGRVQS